MARLIASNLPERWQLENLNIAYPWFSGLHINAMELRVEHDNGAVFLVEISKLTSDFRFKNLHLKGVSLTHQSAKGELQTVNQAIQLPDIALEPLINLLPFSTVTIDALKIKQGQVEYALESLKATLLGNKRDPLSRNITKQLNLKFLLLANNYLSQSSEFEIELSGQANLSHIQIKYSGLEILNLVYANNQKNRKLELLVHTQNINPLISELLLNQSELQQYQPNLSGAFNFKLEQLANSAILTSKIDYEGELDFILNQKIKIPFAFSATSSNSHYPFLVTANSKFKLDELVLVGSEGAVQKKYIFDKAMFELSSTINIEKNRLNFSKLAAKAKLNRAELITEEIAISNLDLNIAVKDFAIENYHSDAFDPQNIISTITINHSDVYLKQQVSSQLKGKLISKGLKASEISGELVFTDIDVPELMASSIDSVDVNLNSVDRHVSQGDASVVIRDHNGRVKMLDYDNLLSKINFQFGSEKIIGTGELLINEKVLTPISLSYDKKLQLFDLSLAKNQLDLTLINRVVKNVIKQLDLADFPEVRLLSGDLVHQGRLSSSTNPTLINLETTKKINLETTNNSRQAQQKIVAFADQIKLKKADVSIGDNQVHQVEITAQIDSLEPLLANIDLKLDKIDLASGLQIKKSSALVALLAENKIEITNLTMSLLSSMVSSEKITITNGQLQPSLINVKGLSLTELLFFTELDNIYAEGSLDLAVPLNSDDKKITVENASFTSRGPGVIKYNSGELPKGSKNIALTALENFKYTQLDGTIDYDKEGLYKIKLHLLGANPDLYNGYPVDFVINLSGNLPGVFKSTFLTGDFEQAILRAVQTQQQSN